MRRNASAPVSRYSRALSGPAGHLPQSGRQGLYMWPVRPNDSPLWRSWRAEQRLRRKRYFDKSLYSAQKGRKQTQQKTKRTQRFFSVILRSEATKNLLQSLGKILHSAQEDRKTELQNVLYPLRLGCRRSSSPKGRAKRLPLWGSWTRSGLRGETTFREKPLFCSG